MDKLSIIIIISVILVVILSKLLAKYTKTTSKNLKSMPNTKNYKQRPLLTENEKRQYLYLKTITDRLYLNIFLKIRVADIVEVKEKNQGDFNRIKAKHIDFIICNQNLDIVCGIEIDDNSHQQPNRIERDKFVNQVFKNCNIPLIRSYNLQKDNIESKLIQLMQFKKN